MEFIDYQEKPIVPKKIKAHRFKKSEAVGLCFNGIFSWEGWSGKVKSNWIFSGDVSDNEFEELRKRYRIKKNELLTYVTVEDKKVIVKHNEWIVIFEDGSIRAMSDSKLKERYVEVK